ncbi:MAG: hypothetical protein KAZ88_13310, partial [Acidimicrobiia bacterium]|nr:hypothetical protein [Acidimicrobiia bacterium]
SSATTTLPSIKILLDGSATPYRRGGVFQRIRHVLPAAKFWPATSATKAFLIWFFDQLRGTKLRSQRNDTARSSISPSAFMTAP